MPGKNKFYKIFYTEQQNRPAQRIRCRFDMFTVLRPGGEKAFPNKKPEWTYKGDKYTSDPEKMLASLLRMFQNHGFKWQLIELYDNTRPRDDPDRIILKVKDGIILKNRVPEYLTMLKNFPLPDYLKTSI